MPPEDNFLSTDVYLINHINPVLRAHFDLDPSVTLYRPKEMIDALCLSQEGEEWLRSPLSFGLLSLNPSTRYLEMCKK
jgi:hypothetical protein